MTRQSVKELLFYIHSGLVEVASRRFHKPEIMGSNPISATGRRNDSDGDDNQKMTGIGKRIGPETIIT